jgi:hypothetical protein
MKIVKMHKGSREAFDDFLAQRLNEVEIDNDTADKYFADMNLPVPVIPATEKTFLAKHKNKLWLLFLLFIVSILTYQNVNNTKNKKQETSLLKNKYQLDNIKEQSNNNIVSTENTFKKEKSVFEMDKKTTFENVSKIVDIEKSKNKISKNKIVQNAQNLLPNNKNIKVKKANNKTNMLVDTVITGTKTVNVFVDKKVKSEKLSTQALKPYSVEKKTTNVDSLYIIW